MVIFQKRVVSQEHGNTLVIDIAPKSTIKFGTLRTLLVVDFQKHATPLMYQLFVYFSISNFLCSLLSKM